MTLLAAASCMLLAGSQAALLPRRTTPTNTSSKAVADPVVLAVTLTTAMSTSTTASSTSTASTAVVETIVPVIEVKADSSSSAVVAAVGAPSTVTSVIASTTTSTSTEQPTVTQSLPPTTNSLPSISTQSTAELLPSPSAETTIQSSSLTSTSLTSFQTTLTSSSNPPLVETGGGIVASTKPTISSTSSPLSSSTNTASPMIAVTMSTSQSVQLSSAPASTISLPLPTKATGVSPAQSSAGGGITVNTAPVKDAAPVMAGVIGGVAFVGILVFLCWRVHKKKRPRQSVFTPTTAHFHRRNHSEKYEIDGESLGPTSRGARWRAQTTGSFSRMQRNLVAGVTSLKIRLFGEDNAPGVNLNRGNSQFLEPIPQHSRTNSSLNQAQNNTNANQDMFGNYFNWFKGKKSRESMDPYADTRRINEKETYSSQSSPQLPQFSPSRDLNLGETGRPRRSLSLDTFPTLTFFDSFSAQPTIPDLSRSPEVVTLNPFADPKDSTSPFTSRPSMSKLVASPQHTRGQSQPMPIGLATPRQYMSAIPMKATPTPRYPPPLHTNLTNNSNDAYVSPISPSDREIKGRSDPFDLERPDLRQPPRMGFADSHNENVSVSPFSTKGIAQRVQMQPRTETVQLGKHQRMVSDAPTYGSSKYSSGFSFFDQWGDSEAKIEPLVWNKPTGQDDKVAPKEGNRKTDANIVGMAM